MPHAFRTRWSSRHATRCAETGTRSGTSRILRLWWARFGLIFALLAPGLAGRADRVSAAPDTGAALESRTDSLFATWNRADSPGCAIGIVRDGVLVYSHGYGAANLELGVPLTARSVCDIGSVSKQFTAFCVHLLVQEGRLRLSDDVRKYLPELPDYDDAAGLHPITIDHLLHHTSGLRDYNDLMVLAGHDEADHTTKQQALDIVSRQTGLNFHPGERHLYSNTGYFLLSVIVERVTGTSMRDFAARRVFGPLNMTHTQFNDSYSRLVAGRAAGYAPTDSGFANAMSDWEQTGDGAVLSTVEDLVQWVNNFETGAVGGREVLARMETPGKLNDGTPVSYASGLDTAPWNGLHCVRHNGAWAGYRAEIVRFPDQRTALICLSNLASMSTTVLCDRMAELWLAEPLAAARRKMKGRDDPTFGVEKLPTAPLATDALRRFVGRYRSGEAGIVEVTLADNELTAGGPAMRPAALRPVGHGRFQRVGGRTVSCLAFDGEGGVPRRFAVQVRGRSMPGLSFERLEPWDPAPAELEAFAGSYASNELDMDADFKLAEGGPSLRYGQLPWTPLERVTTDTFGNDLGTLHFQRDAGGGITGFTLSTPRAQGMLFQRGVWKKFH